MSFQRIYSNPLPIEENGGGDDDELVTISRKEWEDLKTRFATAQASTDLDSLPDHSIDHRTDRTTPLVDAESEASDRAAETLRTTELRRAYRTAILERELATALAEKPLVAGAATQLIKLWREDLDVYEDEGSIKVAARDGRTVAQAVSDWLSTSDYSHFCLASSRGGAGSRGVSTSQSATAGGSKSLGEAILRQWKEATPQPSLLSVRPGWGRPR